MLPVYEVNLSNNGKKVKLLALADRGYSLSWVDKTSADQLNLQGGKRGLTVSGTNGTMAIHQNIVNGDSFYDVQRMQNQYPQLTKVPSNNFNLKGVKVILACQRTDCFSLTRPLEYHRFETGEPCAVRCSLGLTVSGPFPKKIVFSLTSYLSSVHQSPDFDLNEQIRTWWDNESYGSRVKVDGRSTSNVKELETLELWKIKRTVKMTGTPWE